MSDVDWTGAEIEDFDNTGAQQSSELKALLESTGQEPIHNNAYDADLDVDGTTFAKRRRIQKKSYIRTRYKDMHKHAHTHTRTHRNI